MRRAILIYNPTAGQRGPDELLQPVLSRLRRGGFDVEPRPTAGPGDATLIAREAIAHNSLDAVFALGGDGTMRETAVGLLGSDVPLGILPAGTANVLALEFDLPRDAVEAADTLCRAGVRHMDVGLCGETPFLMVASSGLDALVVNRIDRHLKKAMGPLAFIMQGINEWISYEYPEIEVQADGRTHRATFVAICNIAHYGGALKMVPWARCDDGRLDLLLFRGKGRRETMAFAMEVGLTAHIHRRDVEIVPVRQVRLWGSPRDAVQIDGDVCPDKLPLTIELDSRRLRVLASGGRRD